jgi:CIC family chloride channel protein
MTNDYRLIIPLMAGVIVSLILSEKLHKESIYTLKLTRRGIRFRQGRDLDVMDAVKVNEVMMQEPASVPANMPASLLANEFLRTGRHGFPVIDPEGRLAGIVSLEDYRRATKAGEEPPVNLTVSDIATHQPIVAYPDETVGAALHRMAPRDLSRLPVVSRTDPTKLLGVVRRNDIVRAYEVGVVRREEARRRAAAGMEEKEGLEAEFLDFPLPAKADAHGKTIAELGLPRTTVLVSIRRGGHLIIPHGDTRLEAGDVVTALCENGCAESVRQVLYKTKPDEIPPPATKTPRTVK